MSADIGFLKERFLAAGEQTAMIWQDQRYSYAWLLQAIDRWSATLKSEQIGVRDVVGLSADFSPNAVALLLALVEHGCVVVPLTESIRPKRPEYLAAAEVTVDIGVAADDSVTVTRLAPAASHELYQQLWQRERPGLVLFSSGSSGKSKAILHDFQALLDKFRVLRAAKCTITFLLFDHIGGVNTLLHTLSNSGTVVTVQERSPAAICRAVQEYGVQVLPASPTFLNLMLISGVTQDYNLSTLETVTYGTEVMPESTLARFHATFPQIKLLQTYGLSEVGILRSKSEASDSLWVRIGGEGYETRIVDGLLEIKSSSAMLGYLNAPSPFTADGWLMTGDMVEQRDGYFRILGRHSELINVGGEKVFPAEVESVLQQMPGVRDVFVYGAANAITGQMVVAKISLEAGSTETLPELRKRVIQFCSTQLPRFKVPQKVTLADADLHGGRFKKLRSKESMN
ncbi:class I adenylate-forming enzyme family protein [Duganella qianjiadongensis]